MSTKNFQELLAALNQTADDSSALAKSVQEAPGATLDDDPDDEVIAAAAEDGGPAPAAPAAGKPAAPAAAAEEGEVMGKSMTAVDAEGKEYEAFDATEFLKSMDSRQSATEETLAKALGSFTEVVKKQNEMIKSLSDQVTALSSQGRGRKAVLSAVEKTVVGDSTMAKSDGGITPEVFFAKANAAFDAEKLTGKELNVISVCMRSNAPIPQDLISKVMN